MKNGKFEPKDGEFLKYLYQHSEPIDKQGKQFKVSAIITMEEAVLLYAAGNKIIEICNQEGQETHEIN